MNELSSITILAVAMLIAPFIGSFLSVLVVRLPLEEDAIMGRSRCRSCNKPLGPVELIPILSWVLQRGKCSACGASIGSLYPAMEVATTAVAFWACVTVPEEVLIPTILLGWVLLALAVMDARSFFLSDYLTLPLIPAGLVMTWVLDSNLLLLQVLAAVAGFLLIWGAAVAYRLVRGRDGLGMGDAKLMAAAGAWLGAAGLGPVLLIGICVNAVMLAAMRLSGRPVDGSTPVPLGTGIAAGMWLTWLYGPISLSL